MKKDGIALELADVSGAGIVDAGLDCAEVALDGLLGGDVNGFSELFVGIPVLKTVCGLYGACKSLADWHFLKKFATFVDAFNDHMATPEEINRYRKKVSAGGKSQGDQLEYLLVLLERYVGYEKPRMLALIYIAYLDGLVEWDELACYSEVLDRLLPGDYERLSCCPRYASGKTEIDSAVLRLVGLGLMVELERPSAFVSHGDGNVGVTWGSLMASQKDEVVFVRTAFGEKLISITRSARQQDASL